MLGAFHEISITTADIRASVEFYETLGFTHCVTNDTWSHPYGVLTDGRIFLGLHQYRFPSPSITCVRSEIARYIPDFKQLGIELAFAKVGDDCFNEIGFRDPGGQMITILEARTYSPPPGNLARLESHCGYFAEYSLPSADFSAAATFWEMLGFVALEPATTPYASRSLTSDHLDVGLHSPAFATETLLVFRDPTMRERIAKLRDAGVEFAATMPAGLHAQGNAMLTAPEGSRILLLQED
jgi:catechol 2,3-dioxygenase-like lactoylglutathione lyase family enzyme